MRLGLVAGEQIHALGAEELGAGNLNEFLAAPDWDRLERLVDTGGPWRSLNEVSLTAPVEPQQIVQTGANYRTHVIDLVAASMRKDDSRSETEIREAAARMMDERTATGEPYFFIGLPACVVGDDVPWSSRPTATSTIGSWS